MDSYFEDLAKTTKEIDGDNYAKAVQLVRLTENTSISYVQRKLNLGYNRAARIIETMEADGILSKPDCLGKRTVVNT